MKEQTYRTIEAVRKTAEILKFLATQKVPVNGPAVAQAIKMPVGTVMCHLVTLEEAGFVRRVGDGWELGMGLALFWARKKAGLESELARLDREIEMLGKN